MKAFLVNYNFTPTWLLDSGLDYQISDRSDSKEYLKDFPQERIIYEENIGQVDYPKLNYLVDNYDNLPEVFMWGKTNLFKNDFTPEIHVSPHIYMTKEEYDKVKDNQFFTPLLTQHHKVYADKLGVVCYYEDGMYFDRTPLIFLANNGAKFFNSYGEFAKAFGFPNPPYIPFAPGGNYILTKETVHKYSRDLYAKMASLLPYCSAPLEAHFCERVYYTLWK